MTRTLVIWKRQNNVRGPDPLDDFWGTFKLDPALATNGRQIITWWARTSGQGSYSLKSRDPSTNDVLLTQNLPSPQNQINQGTKDVPVNTEGYSIDTGHRQIDDIGVYGVRYDLAEGVWFLANRYWFRVEMNDSDRSQMVTTQQEFQIKNFTSDEIVQLTETRTAQTTPGTGFRVNTMSTQIPAGGTGTIRIYFDAIRDEDPKFVVGRYRCSLRISAKTATGKIYYDELTLTCRILPSAP